MSSIDYSLNNKGVRLIGPNIAWVKSNKGRKILNPNYKFIGKIDMNLPNFVFYPRVKDKRLIYKDDTCNLNKIVKGQISNHFFDKNGVRNKKDKAYLAICKNKKEVL